MRSKPSEITRGRRGERGAALVMSLLVAMLLLAAGGMLIATAGMTASNAADATAEAQAYYAADAGLQAALTVLRRNRDSVNPANLQANFHNFACGTAAACDNDGNDLSQWLGAMPRTLSASPPLSYTLTVIDPSRPTTSGSPGYNLQANYHPRFLLIRSVGRGPQGAVKAMEMMVDDFAFDFTARAAVALHSHDTDTEPMTFSVGTSDPHTWTGNDQALMAPAVPAFGVTNSKDFDFGDLPAGLGNGTRGIAEAAIMKDSTNILSTATQLAKLSQSDLEWWLKDAASARAFLTMMRERAVDTNRYFTTADKGNMGTDADPAFTFVDGDLDMNGSSDSGAGLLIVTGDYKQSGSATYHGLILALGNGSVERDGTPDIAGALVVAAFQHNWDSTTKAYTGNSGFTAPSLTVSGGGNSMVGYHSEWIRKAMESLGPRTVGIVEK